MANYATLKAAIADVIKQNGNNDITGNILQQALLSMIDSLGAGFQYMGVATPATNPGTPDNNVFYLASEPGVYSNFSNFEIADNEVAIFKYNGTWQKESSGFASSAQLDNLESKTTSYLDWTIEHETGSINAITGMNEENANRSRTKGYIYLIPGMTIRRTVTFSVTLLMYDGNKNFLGYDAGYKDYTYQDIINLHATTKYVRLVDQGSTDFRFIINTNGVYQYVVDLIGKTGIPEKTSLGIIKWDGAGTTIDSTTGKDSSYANRNRANGFYTLKDVSEIRFLGDSASYIVYFYDESFNYISYLEKSAKRYDFSDAPVNAVFFRFVINTSVVNTTDVVLGQTVLDILDLQENVETLLKEVFGTLNPLVWAGQDQAINVNNGEDTSTANRNRTNYLTIDDISVIEFDSSEPKYYVCFYDENKNFISPSIGWKTSKTYDLSDKYPTAVYVRIMIDTTTVTPEQISVKYNGLKDAISDANQLVKNAKSILVVDANGNGDYTTIEDALAAADDSPTKHITIFVKPGTYYPAPATPNSHPYNDSNRNLSLIGLDRDACILRGNVGYYYWQAGVDYAVLRLNGNVLIKNFTIINTCENYISTATENGWDLTGQHARAYCIHVDGGRSAGDITRIENCKMYNDHFACVGYGLRANASLIIKNCECVSDVSAENDANSGFSTQYGTLYGHLAAGQTNAPNQRLEILDCILRNLNYERGIAQQDASGATDYSNISAQFLFVRNIIRTVGQVTPYSNSIPSGVYTIDNCSFGNNVDSMNYQ